MDTKALRQKILDLAIHGKLVPQDPNDEPASVLLERIKAEKERLIKEGKIKRSKKSAKTSDTPHYENVPFEIPNSWVWTTIEEICSKIGSGSTPRGSNYSANGIPFFRSQNVYNDRLVYDDIKYISEEVHQKMKGTEVLANDLLLNITGGSLGRCAVVPADFNCGNVSQHVCIMRSVLVEPEYFHALVLSSYFAKSMKITGSGREGLPKYSLEQMAFPLPPLSEQQRIVMEIEKLFALIDQIEHSKVNLQTIIKQTKSKILDLAIHGKLVPQDPNDEPAIELLKRINPDFTPCDNGHSRKLPQGWYSVTANDVCSIIGGVSYNKADIQDTGIRVLRGGNIQNGKVIDCFDDVFISLSYQNNDNQVQRGDIIVVASTGSQTLIGKTGFADRDIPKTQIGAFLRIVRPKQKTLSPYIRLIFQTDAYKDYIRNVAKGSNINNVKNAHLQNFQICLPPLEEQQRIVQKIEELFSSLDDILTALEV
ncbi:restriction endonuclease subunit S [Bacteroides thetaiotaomicron]|jgi:type I restriction enzyme S subunit|uniref:restriction endonuclease subunit S n=7 Tax=Bacteroides TaxID=816 RepID=UPI000705DA55|nr:restriction endonuclease subunit S [Bacteroides thetaiotaomicron]ALJ43093.1 Type-1 restriction enzyme EcoKI specificity protein [Bacteroides thetaiotaomicron]MCE8488196.1 restriction endonuclease subunit S [Bacteroides thetaiotaomicron]MCE8953516.1 restriction endonuclease subunit S [Bacteroides thetaiotaomicron]MCS3003941.1 restriction endonuclease subunit S [Bacteroides thetaiotaomicron]MDC2199313.1 restriction endonuclease subunit S [Bacteroides thetaiotaomicron]